MKPPTSYPFRGLLLSISNCRPFHPCDMTIHIIWKMSGPLPIIPGSCENQQMWSNMSKWGWCRQGAKLWFCCQSMVQESRIILTQKSFWYHFPFQRYEKNKLGMLEFWEFINPCFKQLKVPFCTQVYEASKQHSMENKFSGYVFTPLRYLS